MKIVPKQKKEPVGTFGGTLIRKAADKPKEQISFAIGQTSLGHVLVAVSDLGIVAILLGERKNLVKRLQDRFPETEISEGGTKLAPTLKRVIAFIDNPAMGFDMPLDIRGTDFQRRVWRAVRKIPLGGTSSYSAIAREIGSPRAMRAVGSSCTNNGFAFAIPCHRVVHSNGALSGWQQKLLDHELASQSNRVQRKRKSVNS